MSEEVFEGYSKYYDLLYSDKDYESEAEYVHRTLTKYQADTKYLLEIGMGTGIHASLLQKFGLNVTGIELSDSMAEKARQKGLECTVANFTNFNLNRQFDSVISLFHVVSYLTRNEDLIQALNNVNSHLKTGGIFLFDVWYSPAVYNLRPSVRIKRLKDDDVTITRLAEPIIHWNENVVDVNYEIIIEDVGSNSKIRERHPMRHFSRPELKFLAQLTGFDFIHSEEWLSAALPSEQTWGVTCIFKKLSR